MQSKGSTVNTPLLLQLDHAATGWYICCGVVIVHLLREHSLRTEVTIARLQIHSYAGIQYLESHFSFQVCVAHALNDDFSWGISCLALVLEMCENSLENMTHQVGTGKTQIRIRAYVCQRKIV